MQVGSFSDCEGLAEATKVAIADFQNNGVKAIIVDLRGNGGGDRINMIHLLQFFCDVEWQYEQTAVKNDLAREMDLPSGPSTRGFRITSAHVVTSAPLGQRWQGKVVVLVNRAVMGNG